VHLHHIIWTGFYVLRWRSFSYSVGGAVRPSVCACGCVVVHTRMLLIKRTTPAAAHIHTPNVSGSRRSHTYTYINKMASFSPRRSSSPGYAGDDGDSTPRTLRGAFHVLWRQGSMLPVLPEVPTVRTRFAAAIGGRAFSRKARAHAAECVQCRLRAAASPHPAFVNSVPPLFPFNNHHQTGHQGVGRRREPAPVQHRRLGCPLFCGQRRRHVGRAAAGCVPAIALSGSLAHARAPLQCFAHAAGRGIYYMRDAAALEWGTVGHRPVETAQTQTNPPPHALAQQRNDNRTNNPTIIKKATSARSTSTGWSRASPRAACGRRCCCGSWTSSATASSASTCAGCGVI
jgi:hypothetical protein